jgi:hypothetical protein
VTSGPGRREVWRAGRSVGRTIYIHQGDDEEGRLVGLMDTPELAATVIEAVNAWHAQADPRGQEG